jgi:hypothetical protein
MKKKVRLLLYVIFFSGTFLLALRFDKVQPVWAGPDHQTVPTATSEASPSPSPSATATLTTEATATTGDVIDPDDLTATAEYLLADSDTPTATVDLTAAASQLTRYPTVTPEDDDATTARGRAGLIAAIVAGVLLLLAFGTVAALYWLGAFRDRREEEDQNQVTRS